MRPAKEPSGYGTGSGRNLQRRPETALWYALTHADGGARGNALTAQGT
jgi:hypothetical protein